MSGDIYERIHFWKHHCIERIYGVDHGELWFPKTVKRCSECGIGQ